MVYVFLLLWITCLIFYICTRKYHEKAFADCNKKEHPLRTLYPSCLFLYEKLRLYRLAAIQQKAKSAWRLLAPKGEEKLQFEWYVMKKLSLSFLVGFLAITLSLLLELSIQNGNGSVQSGILILPKGNEATTVDIVLEVEGYKQDNVTFSLTPREEEAQEVTSQDVEEAEYRSAYDYIDGQILANNTSLSMIGTNINLPKIISDTGLSVDWLIEPEGVIYEDGTIQNEDITEPVNVSLCGRILDAHNEEIGQYQTKVTVLPKEQYEYEIWKQSLIESIQTAADESVKESQIILPEEFEGRTIHWKQPANYNALWLLLLGLVVGVLLYFSLDEELSKKIKKRKQQMLLDYPDIVNKLTLLIGAGMTVSGAWDRIVSDYTKLSSTKDTRYAYEEMKQTNQEFGLGVSEMTALEEFGRRVGIVEYMKLSSALIQNMKKGSEGLTQILGLMAQEAFEGRKQRARQMGEEAGTKLLLPMIMMLILVLVLIMVPAFWSMQI